jgi:hypothetical protein
MFTYFLLLYRCLRKVLLISGFRTLYTLVIFPITTTYPVYFNVRYLIAYKTFHKVSHY